MNPETRICQNCKLDFIIEPNDFAFYDKIKVPPPTFCPECRFLRRAIWRNERSLYKRACDATGQSIISMYDQDTKFPVYNRDFWWSDNWDPMDYGMGYDFSKSFFEQFLELFNKVPQASFFGMNLDNCNYCNFFSDSKNCYLCFGGGQNENLAYCGSQVFSKDSFDISLGNKNELCYNSFDCFNSFGVLNSVHSENCVDSMFLFDCRSMNNAICCVNQIHKNYSIWNQTKSKEEYLEEKNKIIDGSYKTYLENKHKFNEFKLQYPVKYARIINSPSCTGDNIKNSNSSKNCFNVTNVENSRYLVWTAGITKDSYDCIGVGMGAELVYEGISNVYNENNVLFSMQCQHGAQNLKYCISCYGCSDLFGCIGLRSKKYCIFNKQYTKEEYEEIVPKIIKQMDSIPYIDNNNNIYKYGEFFPVEFCPFGYNETLAQEYSPLNKDEILEKGYSWKEDKIRQKTFDLSINDLPDNIKDVDESILNKTIECEHKGICVEQCTGGFKIIENELQFIKKMNLPIPRLCPNCRHYDRLKNRNPIKLYTRSCMNNCGRTFETTYTPERPEIIYCESCYQQEVI